MEKSLKEPLPFFDVVLGVIKNDRGQYLVGQRQQHQIYPDYWEFPGGKVEPGESLFKALQREMHEEIGIDVISAKHFLCVPFSYPERRVHIHAFTITQYHHQPCGAEGQTLEWITLDQLRARKNLVANEPILEALQ